MVSRVRLRLSTGLLGMLSLISYAGETVSPDISLRDSGREIYQQRCAVCHGTDAEGAPDWKNQMTGARCPRHHMGLKGIPGVIPTGCCSV